MNTEKTWYKTDNYVSTKITPVRVVKETAAQITIAVEWCGNCSERRVAKSGQYECYFPTWDEAWAYLMKVAERKVLDARQALEHANSIHGNVKGMRRPVLLPAAEDDFSLGQACDLSGEGSCEPCQ